MEKEDEGVGAPTETNYTNTNIFNNVNKRFDEKKVEVESKRILKTGNPIKYILDTFNTIHIGDRRTGEVLVISVGSTCIENCAGIHPNLSGDSGKGKSHSCKTMIHLIPEEYVLNTSLSTKAMFYIPMEDGMVIFSDDIDLSSDLESIIKRSTSEFQQGIEHITVDKMKSKTLRMPKRIAWWLAAVDNGLDMQTLNRQVGVSVDCSVETDRMVREQQLRSAGTGEPEYPDMFEVRVCREIYRTIKHLFVRVVIPFYDRIEWHGEQNRRNLPIFLDMIKVYALFNYQQREHRLAIDDVCEIIANEDDYRHASELYISRAETQTNKLTDNEQKIVDFLGSYGTADINKIKESTGLAYNTARSLLLGRKDRNTGGLLGKVKELQVSDVVREDDGGHVRCKEFTLVRHNRLESYGNIVSLRDVSHQR